MIQDRWQPKLSQFDKSSPNEAWLTKPYILSKALKQVCTTLSVKVLDQRFSKAFDDEYAILAMEQETEPFVRQVFLENEQGTPLTYGRVIIPPQTYQASFKDFEKLGSKLIGETLLYNNPDVTRSGFEFACFDASTPLSQYIYQHLGANVPKQDLWARRSVFNIKNNPLLITELFLPCLPAYVPEVNDVA